MHRPAKPPKRTLKCAPPVTNPFPLDWQDEPGDLRDIEANAIEALCLENLREKVARARAMAQLKNQD